MTMNSITWSDELSESLLLFRTNRNDLKLQKLFYESIDKIIDYELNKYSYKKLEDDELNDLKQEIFEICLKLIYKFNENKLLSNNRKPSLKSYFQTMVRGKIRSFQLKKHQMKVRFLNINDYEF